MSKFIIVQNGVVVLQPTEWNPSVFSAKLYSIGVVASLPEREPTGPVAFGNVRILPVETSVPTINSKTQCYGTPTLTVLAAKATYVFPVEDFPEQVKRNKLKEAVTSLRWEHETSGITLPNGVSIDTGLDSQSRIGNAYSAAKNGVASTFDFKGANGWVSLSAAEIMTIGEAVFTHVQASFTRERFLHDYIDNMPASELNTFDYVEAWQNLN